MLTPMKKIEVVVPGDRLSAVKDVFAAVEVSGYTIVPNVSGMGHHGYHEGRLLFNELSSQALLIAVVPPGRVDAIVAGLEEIFAGSPGVVFVSDCSVRRSEYFVPGKTTA
jgi:nitrogen regulatory protein PII